MEVKHVKHVMDQKYFEKTWPDVDVESWPGRELYWLWRHPVLGGLIVVECIALITLILT